jgi:hypothetical protein
MLMQCSLRICHGRFVGAMLAREAALEGATICYNVPSRSEASDE